MRVGLHFAQSYHVVMRFVIFPLARIVVDIWMCLTGTYYVQQGKFQDFQQFVFENSMLTALKSRLDHARLPTTCGGAITSCCAVKFQLRTSYLCDANATPFSQYRTAYTERGDTGSFLLGTSAGCACGCDIGCGCGSGGGDEEVDLDSMENADCWASAGGGAESAAGAEARAGVGTGAEGAAGGVR